SPLARAGLTDSKQLTREQRETLDRRIRKVALCFAIAEVDAETIDRLNIYQASRLAMLLAVQRLTLAPDHLLIDALRIDHSCAQTKLYYGDALSLSIAAASVIAKVHRDALMRELDQLHPQYGLASHKGYATPEHRKALREHGPCPLHRKTFAPVAASDPNATPDPNAALDITLTSGDLFLDDDPDPLDELLTAAPDPLEPSTNRYPEPSGSGLIAPKEEGVLTPDLDPTPQD
ncbi:MAG: ribonuclease HII, partial [Acidobacteriaceae bacterium]